MNSIEQQHDHNWQPTDTGYACTECSETTSACNTCHQPLNTELATCDRCIKKAKAVITDTVEALTTIPFDHGTIMGLRAVRYDRVIVKSSRDANKVPFGLDRFIEDPTDTRIAAAKHPLTAVDTLVAWAQAWAEHRKDHYDSWSDYLVHHTLWAAQNADESGWHTYLDEAREVRSTVRRLLGINPQQQPAPCVYCGGRIVQEWTPDGLDDALRCTGCHLTWGSHESLRYTNRHTMFGLPETHPDALVTAEDARRILPDLKRNTLNQALKRDRERDEPRIPERGHNVRGEPLYRLGDITTTLRIEGIAA